MVQKFHLFNTVFSNDELDNEFTNFFYKYGLTPLFTNEHRTSSISVTYLDAKSVINTGGAYNKLLLDFSDLLSIAVDNQVYEQAVFKVIYNATTFQKMMNNIKNILREFNRTAPQHQFNFWNIVFYTKELF